MPGSGTKNGRVAPAKPEANGVDKGKRLENGKPGEWSNRNSPTLHKFIPLETPSMSKSSTNPSKLQKMFSNWIFPGKLFSKNQEGDQDISPRSWDEIFRLTIVTIKE